VQALFAERKATCPGCGYPTDVCRDPSTAGTWQVHTQICEPGRVMQAATEDTKTRGLYVWATRTGG